jgi:hypothetical protein
MVVLNCKFCWKPGVLLSVCNRVTVRLSGVFRVGGVLGAGWGHDVLLLSQVLG